MTSSLNELVDASETQFMGSIGKFYPSMNESDESVVTDPQERRGDRLDL
jgi:hypothetical protein